MKTQLQSPDESSAQRVMALWSDAMVRFRSNYTNLDTYVRKALREENAAHIGQCPVGELIKLCKVMQGELERLLNDMDRLDRINQPLEEKMVKKLATHALSLNRLNHQAEIRLHLLGSHAV